MNDVQGAEWLLNESSLPELTSEESIWLNDLLNSAPAGRRGAQGTSSGDFFWFSLMVLIGTSVTLTLIVLV